MLSNSYRNTVLAQTTVLKTSSGFLHTVTVNTTANGAIDLYDNTTATGTKIAKIKASVAEQTFVYDLNFINGLTMVTAAASDVTVTFT